jgi:hypothetical protein
VVLNNRLRNVLIDCILVVPSFYNLEGTIKRRNGREEGERERFDHYLLDVPKNLGLICNFSRIP